MNTAVVFLTVASIIAVIVLFSVVPMVDSSISYTGAALSNATGYSGDTTNSNAAIASIWQVAPILVIMALFVMLLTER